MVNHLHYLMCVTFGYKVETSLSLEFSISKKTFSVGMHTNGKRLFGLVSVF